MTQDPIDLLIAFEEASVAPIRPEDVEGTVIVPPQPNHEHNAGAFKLAAQFYTAGLDLAGMGNGYRGAHKDGGTMALTLGDPLPLPASCPTLDTTPFLDD